MSRILFGLFALIGIAAAGLPATAQTAQTAGSHELAAQSRPRITIYPRRGYLTPTSKRHCRAWLAQEYRVSGPVIVPRQQCWWD